MENAGTAERFRWQKRSTHVLTGFLHVVIAIIYVPIVLRSAHLTGKIRSKNSAQIEMCTTYWHFLGGPFVCSYFCS